MSSPSRCAAHITAKSIAPGMNENGGNGAVSTSSPPRRVYGGRLEIQTDQTQAAHTVNSWSQSSQG
jgi:hypothetical protein